MGSVRQAPTPYAPGGRALTNPTGAAPSTTTAEGGESAGRAVARPEERDGKCRGLPGPRGGAGASSTHQNRVRMSSSRGASGMRGRSAPGCTWCIEHTVPRGTQGRQCGGDGWQDSEAQRRGSESPAAGPLKTTAPDNATGARWPERGKSSSPSQPLADLARARAKGRPKPCTGTPPAAQHRNEGVVGARTQDRKGEHTHVRPRIGRAHATLQIIRRGVGLNQRALTSVSSARRTPNGGPPSGAQFAAARERGTRGGAAADKRVPWCTVWAPEHPRLGPPATAQARKGCCPPRWRSTQRPTSPSHGPRGQTRRE